MKDLFKKIGKDKLGHFKAGAIIALAGSVLFGSGVGLALAFLAGAGKEGMDYYANWKAEKEGLKQPHSVEFLDFWFTLVGGMIVVAFFALL